VGRAVIQALITTSGDGTEAVRPEETILRRVLESNMEGARRDRISPRAFKPRAEKDKDGLSCFREKYHDPASVACAPPDFVRPRFARLRVRELFELKLSVRADPFEPNGVGHCLIPELTSLNRSESWAGDLHVRLAHELSECLGPFNCGDEKSAA